MRHAHLTILLVLLIASVSPAQSTSRSGSRASWNHSTTHRADEASTLARQREQLADSVRRSRPAADAFPVPDHQRAQASGYRNEATRVEPVQYRDSGWPDSSQAVTSADSTTADQDEDDNQHEVAPIYTSPTQPDSLYRTNAPSDPFQRSAEPASDMHSYPDRDTGILNNRTYPVSDSNSNGTTPASRDSQYGNPEDPVQTPTSSWNDATTVSTRSADATEASTLRTSPTTPDSTFTTPPYDPTNPTYDATRRDLSERRTTTDRRDYPLSVLLLFASIGLNIYLSWIAVDTYNRYQDLVSDMRTTRSQRERGDAERYADDAKETATY